MIGFQSGRLQFTDLNSYPTLVERDVQRPLEHRWISGAASYARGREMVQFAKVWGTLRRGT